MTPGIAHESRQAADGLRQIALGQASDNRARVLAHQRDRQKRQQARTDAHRAGAGAAAAVRRREGLVQIHVDDVEAHVAGADLAENGVEIRAVVVEQAAGLVHDARHLRDPVLEHARAWTDW